MQMVMSIWDKVQLLPLNDAVLVDIKRHLLKQGDLP